MAGRGWAILLLAMAGCSEAEKPAGPAPLMAKASPAQTSSAPVAPPGMLVAAQVAASQPGAGRVAEFRALKPTAGVPRSSGRVPGQPGDTRDSYDHPAVGRYQGARIVTYRQKQFDSARLFHAPVADAGKPQPSASVMAEGRVTDIAYLAPRDRSLLEILRSYQQALAASGFETAWSCTPDTCLETAQAIKDAMGVTTLGIERKGGHALAAFRRSDGVRLNLAVAPDRGYEPRILLRVVEPAAMEAGVRTLSASDIGRDVAAQGRAVLYAVEFDTDKATLRPGSAPQLKAIADWLNSTKARALVVGHTDSQGAFAYNVDLSQRRAEAVVAELTKRHGVDGKRLTAFGAGMGAPVASNRTPDGQARNRRVELVELP